MKLEHDRDLRCVTVERTDTGMTVALTIASVPIPAPFELDADELRWLLVVAGPAVLTTHPDPRAPQRPPAPSPRPRAEPPAPPRPAPQTPAQRALPTL